MMNNHKKKINDLKKKKSASKINNTTIYREICHDNPKRNYFL